MGGNGESLLSVGVDSLLISTQRPIPFTSYPTHFLFVTLVVTNFRDCSKHLYEVNNKPKSTVTSCSSYIPTAGWLDLCMVTLAPRPRLTGQLFSGTEPITMEERQVHLTPVTKCLSLEVTHLTAHSLARMTWKVHVPVRENLSILQAGLLFTTPALRNHYI